MIHIPNILEPKTKKADTENWIDTFQGLLGTGKQHGKNTEFIEKNINATMLIAKSI